MKTLLSVLFVPALALASACAPNVNDPADVQAIRQTMEDYFKAANINDTAASVAMMTDQTILFEPHTATLVGREAIGKLHQGFLDQYRIDAKSAAVDVRVVGDLGVAHGTYAETITPKTEELASVTDSGRWLVVARRQPDRTWKWDWVIANSERPLPGMTADGADEQALIDIERGFVTAAKTRDIAFFERTLAKEYAQVADGKPVNVAAQLADMKAGLVRIESITMRNMRAHVFGDAAIVSMVAESKGTYKGKPIFEKARGIDFFVKRDGRWQVVNSQMTTIKE